MMVQYASMHRLIISCRTFKKEGISYVETERAVSPFSFANYIVYNPSHYPTDELKAIMEHERIHVRGVHSVDVFLTLALLVLQWFNPFAWLFRRAVQQNLEFIADQDTLSAGISSKAYQYLLLKANFNINHFSATNTFFNSLIKKRIYMINRKRTSSKHLFKYGIPFPFLIAFIILFNIRTEAKVGLQTPVNHAVQGSTQSARTYTIMNATSAAALEALAKTIRKENGTLTLKKVKRNEDGKIIELALEYRLSASHFVTGSYAKDSGISTVYFGISADGGVFVSTNENPNLVVPHGSTPFNFSQDSVNGEVHALGITTGIQPFDAKPLIIMDGKEVPYATFQSTKPEEIQSMNVLKGPYATRRFGKELKNGAIEVTTKKSWETSVGLMPAQPEKTSGVMHYYRTATANQPDINEALIIIDGKESSKEALDQIMSDKNESITSSKGEEAIDKYGEKAKDGVVKIRQSTGDAKRQAKPPLLVIDGEVSSESALNDLDRNRIKAMNVLKGENALKKYGDRAKDGAIEITTIKD